MGKVFTKGLDKDDKEEGLLKRLKNIEDKNEELPNPLSQAIKAGKNASYESDFYYDPTNNLRRFYRDFGKFKKMASLESKCNELIDFYKLFRDFKNLEPPNDDEKKLKIKVMNKTHQFYNKYFEAYKKECNSEDLNKEEKFFLAIASKKYLIRKKKSQCRLKKKLRESFRNHYDLK